MHQPFNAVAGGLRGVGAGPVRRRILAMYGFLAALNLAAWGLAFAVFHSSPAMLGLCLVAYGFGLRHAVDADHIAAIDNVTRKLMQQGQRPVAVGLFFSLGHSLVVLLLSLLVAVAAGYMEEHYPQLQRLTGIIGTSVSALFLLLIALINFLVFLRVYRTYREVRRGEAYNEGDLEDFLDRRGLIARLVRPLFRLVGRSWQMFPVGFLFGLGFDTATEIALLGIAAGQASQAAPLWSIMVFPLLFTSGMCLVDATDGVVMLGAYGWAFIDPARKLWYNMTITLASFLIAFVVGGVEVLGLIASQLDLDGGPWAFVNAINDNSEVLGYSIIGVLLAGWLACAVAYKGAGRDSPTGAAVVPAHVPEKPDPF